MRTVHCVVVWTSCGVTEPHQLERPHDESRLTQHLGREPRVVRERRRRRRRYATQSAAPPSMSTATGHHRPRRGAAARTACTPRPTACLSGAGTYSRMILSIDATTSAPIRFPDGDCADGTPKVG